MKKTIRITHVILAIILLVCSVITYSLGNIESSCYLLILAVLNYIMTINN